MQITTTNLNYNKAQSPVSFGHITPNHLFIRHSGFSKDAGWAKTMAETVEHSSKKIRRGWKFSDVLDYIADKYQTYFMRTQNLSEFGDPRAHEIATPVAGERYGSYLDAARELVIKQSEKNFDRILPKRFFRILVDRTYDSYMAVRGDVHTMTMDINGEKIPLTRTFRVYEFPKGITIVRDKNERYEALIWLHTGSEHLPELLSHADSLYSKIKKDRSSNLNTTIDNIAELHWLLCQAAPFDRGSAGIADLITKSLFEAKRIQVSPWKKSIVPDLEALTTPLEIFKSRYASFFQKRPKYMD